MKHHQGLASAVLETLVWIGKNGSLESVDSLNHCNSEPHESEPFVHLNHFELIEQIEPIKTN